MREVVSSSDHCEPCLPKSWVISHRRAGSRRVLQSCFRKFWGVRSVMRINHCLRCENDWCFRGTGRATRCGKCKSPYWDREDGHDAKIDSSNDSPIVERKDKRAAVPSVRSGNDQQPSVARVGGDVRPDAKAPSVLICPVHGAGSNPAPRTKFGGGIPQTDRGADAGRVIPVVSGSKSGSIPASPATKPCPVCSGINGLHAKGCNR